jgi:hypothetical protein
MNERIRELAEQAGLESFYVEYSPWQVEFEKFAELIVGECVSQLNIPDVPGPISAGLNLGKIAIKQHFGVEE